MSVLALVLALGVAGVRLGAIGVGRAEAVQNGLEELRVVHTFVRDRIAEALPVIEGEPPTVVFAGRSDSLGVVAIFPTQSDMPGFRRVDFGVARRGVVYDLVFTEMSLGLSSRPVPRVLATGFSSVRFAYFGAKPPDERPRWHDEWEKQGALPKLVRLSFDRHSGIRPWPPLIVAPALDREIR